MQAGRNGHPVVWTPDKAYELLPQLGRLRARRGEQMSGGELQMLAIARALMSNGQLLMLDEPFEGLAPTIVEGLWKVINELKKEMTTLLVEQNADLALSLGDRVYVVNNGKIEFEGAAQTIIDDHELRQKLWASAGPVSRPADAPRDRRRKVTTRDCMWAMRSGRLSDRNTACTERLQEER